VVQLVSYGFINADTMERMTKRSKVALLVKDSAFLKVLWDFEAHTTID
jgi:hypothetical protein